MNIEEELDKLKERIPERLSVDELMVLKSIFEDSLEIALSKAHRKKPVPALIVIVRNYTLSVWNKRGDEGMTDSGAGGQSFNYEDAEKKLSDEIIRAGLRVIPL